MRDYPIATELKGNLKFEVYDCDYSSIRMLDECEWENEADKQQFIEDWEDGKFGFFRCVTLEKCLCCQNYKHIESCSSIQAKDAWEALEYWIEEKV
jgi:hypothetical protein